MFRCHLRYNFSHLFVGWFSSGRMTKTTTSYIALLVSNDDDDATLCRPPLLFYATLIYNLYMHKVQALLYCAVLDWLPLHTRPPCSPLGVVLSINPGSCLASRPSSSGMEPIYPGKTIRGRMNVVLICQFIARANGLTPTTVQTPGGVVLSAKALLNFVRFARLTGYLCNYYLIARCKSTAAEQSERV